MERTFQKLGCSKGRGSKVRKEMVSVAGGLGGVAVEQDVSSARAECS